MVIDQLKNSGLYTGLSARIEHAFAYLHTTTLNTIPVGRYEIDGDDIFALVQEYETKPISDCVMEAHKKYLDIQLMIRGAELVGHALLYTQEPALMEYSEEKDLMLFPDEPSFVSIMGAGTFMIFFPGDIHMPCIQIEQPEMVKKIVVKVKM